jgi:lipopolysaccharide biosynthesis regulator YciM
VTREPTLRAAVEFILRVDQGVIIRNLRLTEAERALLKERTGQDRQLLGYNVETVEPPRWRCGDCGCANMAHEWCCYVCGAGHPDL